MQRLCQCFVGVLYFFGGRDVFLEVLVVLERFAVLGCDFFVKKLFLSKVVKMGL